MRKLRVLISSSQLLFRKGVHFALSDAEDFEIVGETAEDGLPAAVEASLPDLVVVVTRDGDAGPLKTIRQIRLDVPSTSFVVISGDRSEDWLFDAVKSGASAVLQKDIDEEELADVVRDVASGAHPATDLLLLPGLAARARGEFATSPLREGLEDVLPHLTLGESTLLDMIASGADLPQVSARLDIGEEAVRQRLQLVLHKLIENDRVMTMIDGLWKSVPELLSRAVSDKLAEERLAREDLVRLRDSVLNSLKGLIAELESLTRQARARRERLTEHKADTLFDFSSAET